MAAGWLSEDEQQQLHRAEKGLRGCFVAGAPATITYNIETGRGLVNGCDATMHSLTLANGESVASLVEEARHDPSRWDDGVLVVNLDDPPLSVNAVPIVGDETRAFCSPVARRSTPMAARSWCPC